MQMPRASAASLPGRGMKYGYARVSTDGQSVDAQVRQRYINGSSGQVEIYPQDIARLWIPPKSKPDMKKISDKLRDACAKHSKFFIDMKAALSML
jgi:hypothetical protein